MSEKSWVIKCPHCRHEKEWGETTLQAQHIIATATVLKNPANARALLENYSIACLKCGELMPFEPRSEYRRRKALAVSQRVERLLGEVQRASGDERGLLALAARCGATVLQVLETDMPLEIVFNHEDKLLDALAEEIRATGADPRRHRAWRWLQETFALACSGLGERDDLPQAEPDEATEKREAFLKSLGELANERAAEEPAQRRSAPAAGAPRGGERHRFELAHHNNVEAVAISRDGRLGLSVGWNDIVNVWDLEAGRTRARLQARGKFLTSVCFLGDESRVAAAGSSGELFVWDLASGRELHRLNKHSFTIHDLAASADGRLVITGSGDGTARVWDTVKGAHLRKLGGLFGGTHDGALSAVAISPDGQWALTAGGPQADTVKVWELSGGQPVRTTLFPERATVGLAFMGSGRQAIVQSGHKLRIMDVAEGKELGLIAATEDDFYDCFDIARGGEWMAGGVGSEVLIIQVNAGPAERIRRRFRGHQADRSIGAVAITPDGRRAISGGDDCAVIVWDTGI
jgi:WD40 repeat protein